MPDSPNPSGVDPEDIVFRSPDGTAADAAGQFVANAAAEGCAHGCAQGCGCMVLIALGLFLSAGSAIAAMTWL